MSFQINQATIFPSKAENSSAFLCHILCNGLVITSERPWVKPGASAGHWQKELLTGRATLACHQQSHCPSVEPPAPPNLSPTPPPDASEIQGAHFSSRHRSGTSPAQLEHLLCICITSQDLSTGFFSAEMRAIKKTSSSRLLFSLSYLSSLIVIEITTTKTGTETQTLLSVKSSAGSE